MRRRTALGLGLSLSSPLVARAAFARTARPPSRAEVVIVGAGLCGLATALGLQKAGIPYHLLELGPRAGGRVRTVRYRVGGESLYADSGMEEYWESNPAVRLLEQLRLPTRSDVALSSVVLDGAIAPLGGADRTAFLTRVLGADGLAAWRALEARLAPTAAELRARKPSPATLALAEPAFEAWIAAQRLPRRLADWIRVSVECESGASWDQISALEGIAELTIFFGDGERSFRVLGGNDRFTTALARAAGTRNLSLQQRVTRIEARGGRHVVHHLDLERNESASMEARHVVVTVPLFRLFELQLDPPLPEAKRRAITSQFWGAYFKAHLFLPRAAWRVFEPEGEPLLPLLTDSELGVMYDGNPDQTTRTRVLSLLVTGPHAEQFNMLPQDEARARLLGRLDQLFPGLSRQVSGVELYRYHPRAVAAWPPGRSRFDALSDELRCPEGTLHLAGDFTESSHSDGAFISAARVVAQIRAARA